MNDGDETTRAVKTLSALGAGIDFFAQRIMYLQQHPDARPAQELRFDDDAAFTSVLVTGALVDLLVDISGGTVSREDFDAPMTENGVDLHLRVRRDPDESRPGYRIMKLMASSMVFDRERGHLTICVTGTSVAAGLPKWQGPGCRPVIVG
jgi:hypothetical protein